MEVTRSEILMHSLITRAGKQVKMRTTKQANAPFTDIELVVRQVCIPIKIK